jgi:hypothetical protein
MTRKLPEPQAGSNTRMRAMRLRRFSSLRGLSPASSSFAPQIVEEQRVQHLQDVRHAGVVHAQRAALLVIGDGLDHRPEDVRVDLRPVEAADVQQVGAGDLAEARHVGAAGKQPAVHIGELVGPAGKPRLRDRRSWCSWRGTSRDHLMGVGRITARSSARRCGEQPLPWKMSVSSAKKQKISRAMK